MSCPIGFDCPGTGPILCTSGYYCTPIGFFQSSAASQSACPSGYYNFNPGSKYLADCIPCPQNYYCPKGTVSPIICPVGYYCPQ